MPVSLRHDRLVQTVMTCIVTRGVLMANLRTSPQVYSPTATPVSTSSRSAGPGASAGLGSSVLNASFLRLPFPFYLPIFP